MEPYATNKRALDAPRSQSGLGRRAEPRQAELLHSLTVKLTETFLLALRQAAQEEAGGVRKAAKRERVGSVPAASYR